MKDIPVFDTQTGVSTLMLREVPYKETAYIRVQSVQPEGLREHLDECVSFCRMCGAEHVFAAGHPGLDAYALHCSILKMNLSLTQVPEPEGMLFPVTESTVGRWREIYNKKMAPVDNAATLTAYDEKRILSSGGGYFVHADGVLLGIGWVCGGEILAVAACVPGAGRRVMHTLLSTLSTDLVTLEVASTNERAIRLYRELGFVIVEERTRWYRIR